MATQVSGASRWLTLNGVPLRFGPGTINTVDGVREYKESQFRITEAAPDDVEIRVDSERLVTERYGRWIWRPAGFAGLYDVEVSAPNHGVHKTQVRVLPGNITLRQQARMYKDITDISVDLLFQLHTPAREYVGTISGEAHPIVCSSVIRSAASGTNPLPWALTHRPSPARQWRYRLVLVPAFLEFFLVSGWSSAAS
jgi:hypothetical protein